MTQSTLLGDHKAIDDSTPFPAETSLRWPIVRVKEVKAASRNALASGPFGSNLGSGDYVTEGVPVIRGKNLNHGKWIGGEFVYVSQQKANQLKANLCQPSDLIFTQRGTVGQVALVPSSPFSQYVISQSQMKLTVDIGKVIPEYVYAYFQSSAGQNYLITSTIATGLPHINLGILANAPMLLPPLLEQRRIVEILDESDAAVRTTEALIAAKLKHKRAWAERLLTGKVRFPEFAGETWREAGLGEFFRDRNARYKGDEPPVVLSCSKIRGIVPQTDLFSRILASKDLGRYKFVEPGDLVFDPMLLWDASINFSTRRGVVSPAYSTLQFVAAHAEPRFFHYLFDTHALRHVYKTISQGTNTRRKKATAADFLKLRVRLPGQQEQQRIAEVLGLMDEEITLRRRQLTALKAQKQGLMQKLLTGEVRVKEFAP